MYSITWRITCFQCICSVFHKHWLFIERRPRQLFNVGNQFSLFIYKLHVLSFLISLVFTIYCTVLHFGSRFLHGFTPGKHVLAWFYTWEAGSCMVLHLGSRFLHGFTPVKQVLAWFYTCEACSCMVLHLGGSFCSMRHMIMFSGLFTISEINKEQKIKNYAPKWDLVTEIIVDFVLLIRKFKDGLKIKNLHIHLYFIATQYLWNYALLEDIDNWTRSYILIDNWTRSYILIIIYWNRQK